MSESSLKQSKFDLLPAVNAESGFSYRFGRSLDPTTYEYVEKTVQFSDLSLNADLTLFNGLKNMNQIKKSKLDLKASQSSLEEMKQNITLNVVQSFLRVLVTKEELDLARKQAKFSRQQVEKTKKLVDAGSQAEGELEQVRSQLMADKHQRTVAANNLNIARLNLKQLMEIPPEDTLRVEVPSSLDYSIGEIEKKNPRSIYNEAVNDQPSIQRSQYKIRSAQKGVAIAKGNYYPRLSAYYNIGTNYSDANEQIQGIEPTGGIDTVGFVSGGESPVVRPSVRRVTETTPLDKQIERNLNQSVGLSLTIPIFNKWQTRTAVQQSKIDLANTKLELKKKKNQLQKDIHQAYTEAKAAARQLESARQSVKSAEKSFSYAEERYNQGLISSYELTAAKNQLTEARSSLIKAKYDYIFKLKILAYYQGDPISLE